MPPQRIPLHLPLYRLSSSSLQCRLTLATGGEALILVVVVPNLS